MTDGEKTRELMLLMDPDVVARPVAQAEARKPTALKTVDPPEPVSVDATETVGPEADDTDPAMDNDARPRRILLIREHLGSDRDRHTGADAWH